MILLFLFTCIELIVFSFFNPISELQQYFFVIINIVVLIFIIQRSYPEYKTILMLGLILRLVLLIIDYNKIFPILHSGVDTETFNAYATINALNGNIDSGRTSYNIILSSLYILLGPSRLIAQYVNVLFGMGVLIFLYKIFKELKLSKKNERTGLIIAAFFPHLIIFSGILLREAWCQFFVTVSLYYFIKWIKSNNFSFFIVSIAAVLGASWMHAGCLFVGVGYLTALIFYKVKKKKSEVTFGSLVIFMVAIIAITAFMTLTDSFTEKIDNFNEEDMKDTGLYGNIKGKSAYLLWINPNSTTQLLIFAPLKMFYFMFSPIPMDWRGFQDVVAFLFDSLIYFFLVFAIFKNYKRIRDPLKKNIFKYIIISIVFFCFVFGYGTTTSGTAIRHRCKLFPLVLTAYAISVSEKRKYMTVHKV